MGGEEFSLRRRPDLSDLQIRRPANINNLAGLRAAVENHTAVGSESTFGEGFASGQIGDGPTPMTTKSFYELISQKLSDGEFTNLDSFVNYLKTTQLGNEELRTLVNQFVQEIEENKDDLGNIRIDGNPRSKEFVLHNKIIKSAQELKAAEIPQAILKDYITIMTTNQTYEVRIQALKDDPEGRFYPKDVDGNPISGVPFSRRQNDLDDFIQSLVDSQMAADATAYLLQLGDELKGKTADEIKRMIIAKHTEKMNGITDQAFADFINNSNDMVNFIKGLNDREARVAERKEELKDLTWADIESGLGHDLAEKLRDYMVMVAQKEGEEKYDISNLSDIISRRIGADILINHEDPQISEMSGIKRDLQEMMNEYLRNAKETKGRRNNNNSSNSQTNIELTLEEAEKIATFCGFEVEPRDHSFGAQRSKKRDRLAGAMIGGIGGTLGAVGTITLVKVTLEVGASQAVSQAALAQIDALSSLLAQSGLDLGLHVGVITTYLPGIVAAVAAGAILAPYAIMLVKAMIGEKVIEKECFPKNERTLQEFDNKNTYIEYLKKNGLYEMIQPILDEFPITDEATGAWDKDGFFNELEMIAGVGTKLNCEEILATVLRRKKPETSAEIENKTIIETVLEETQEDSPTHLEGNGSMPEQNTADTQIFFDGICTSWQYLANNAYKTADGRSLKDKYGLSTAIRMLKIAQAVTNPEFYSEDQLRNLAEISIRGGRKALKKYDGKGINYAVFCNMLDATWLPRPEKGRENETGLKLPLELGGLQRTQDIEDYLCDPNAKAPDRDAPKVAPQSAAQANIETHVEYDNTTSSNRMRASIRVNGVEIGTYTDKTTYEAAMEQAKTDNPNADVTTYDTWSDYENAGKKKEEDQQQ